MADELAPYAPVAAAAVSALVSAAVAWFTARRKVRIELEKLNVAAHQGFLLQLVAARLVAYPELYYLISEPQKATGTFVSNRADLRGLLEKVNAWDSKHALLLGPHTLNVCYEFRKELAQAAGLPIETPAAGQAVKAGEPADLLQKANLLEQALRSDLGIYGIRAHNGNLSTPDTTDWPDDVQRHAEPDV